jgi:hypothetical protein
VRGRDEKWHALQRIQNQSEDMALEIIINKAFGEKPYQKIFCREFKLMAIYRNFANAEGSCTLFMDRPPLILQLTMSTHSSKANHVFFLLKMGVFDFIYDHPEPRAKCVFAAL